MLFLKLPGAEGPSLAIGAATGIPRTVYTQREITNKQWDASLTRHC